MFLCGNCGCGNNNGSRSGCGCTGNCMSCSNRNSCSAYQAGYQAGLAAGRNSGYHEGFNIGYRNGYQEGCRNCSEAAGVITSGGSETSGINCGCRN